VLFPCEAVRPSLTLLAVRDVLLPAFVVPAYGKGYGKGE